jgi:hypothetical protein
MLFWASRRPKPAPKGFNPLDSMPHNPRNFRCVTARDFVATR